MCKSWQRAFRSTTQKRGALSIQTSEDTRRFKSLMWLACIAHKFLENLRAMQAQAAASFGYAGQFRCFLARNELVAPAIA